MPTPPKSTKIIIIIDASIHVFWCFNTIHESPSSCHSPDCEKLIPYKYQIEETHKVKIE